MDYSKEAIDNTILKVRVGSHLFGTNTEDSDLDIEGIFMPPISVLYGLGECKEVDLSEASKDEKGRNTSDAIDFKLREYRTFMRLAIQNNPNILNIVFSNDENVIFQDEFGERLRGMAEYFPYRDGLRRYYGYAQSQLQKMTIKPDNYSYLNKALDFLSGCNQKAILVDVIRSKCNPLARVFIDKGPGKHVVVADLHCERGLQVGKVVSMINGRLERASSRADNWERFGYDVKFASNLIQILKQGIELGKTGVLKFPLGYRDLILDIKKGKFKLSEVDNMATDLIEEMISIIEGECCLPKKPRRLEIGNFTIIEVKKWCDKQFVSCH